ncbi:MBL fold metallo-hydrolase [Desulfosarcina ovata]|uniref:MBL fold metallo-hydrolase n=2 Tax=Desulfosarcina ovata TaxID=83564 RepID=A0A5K8AEC9_9BACT|nr:MBL fold metallo-hydrolase [Desulfosarcina ovata]BBO84462.1 MBL fold metallo-hydrolase [Desulfosarcina ovata subsp. sediminis]BBO90975.1 MBL fold metallo-hydrolase [Desulfosarcina ovata subsp. ovata]
MELTPHLHAFLWTSMQANNCNTYLLRSDEKNILVDPGHAAHFEHVERGLRQLNLSVADIDLVICTHAHPDHIEAVRFFVDTKAQFTLHGDEWQLIQNMPPYLRRTLAIDPEQFAPDFFLTEGELNVGDIALEIYHTPGHSPGGVTLRWPAERAMFTGDLIFRDGLGRTDLPGGNGVQLKASIRRMGELTADWLLSGHGEVVTGTDAVRENFRQVEATWFAYV